jgi:acyl carrier protein
MTELNVREDTERVLAEFWAELLDVDSIDADDHLLELGGNSLVATMVANRVELAWGFRPSMEELLGSSLRELAASCESRRAEEPEA